MPLEDAAAEVAAALADEAETEVLLVCTSQSGLEAEVEQVAQIQASVQEASDRQAVFVYASHTDKGSHRRSLQTLATYEGFGNYTTCGVLCQVCAISVMHQFVH